ncbi:MAG: carboxylase, partial [Rikenellaceae bacterium]|nr:carboxylase [Rikenellaceae bacterium]
TGTAVEEAMPGKIFKMLDGEGDAVAAGQDVVILEAMKMENNLSTPVAGKVKRIFVSEGDTIPAGGFIMEIE